MTKKPKGMAPLVTSILIVGILIVITFIAYSWGMPLIQRNIDISKLSRAEKFLLQLDQKIYDVTKTGGADEITFNIPAEINISAEEDRIEFFMKTSGSIYQSGEFICLSRNCNLSGGVWGKDTYSVIGIQVDQFGKYAAITTFSINYRNLTAPDGRVYRLDILTPGNSTLIASEGTILLIKKKGEERGNITKTFIEMDIK